MKYLMFLDNEQEICGVMAKPGCDVIVPAEIVGAKSGKMMLKAQAESYQLWGMDAHFCDSPPLIEHDLGAYRSNRYVFQCGSLEWLISWRLNGRLQPLQDPLRVEGDIVDRRMSLYRASTSSALPDMVAGLISCGIDVREAYHVSPDQFIIDGTLQPAQLACDDYSVARLVLPSAARCLVGIESVDVAFTYRYERSVGGENVFDLVDDVGLMMLEQFIRDNVAPRVGGIEGVTGSTTIQLGKHVSIHSTVNLILEILSPLVLANERSRVQS